MVYAGGIMNDMRAELDALSQRIARLEKQNRRLRQVWMVGGLLALLIVLPEGLRARQKLELKPVPQAADAGNAVAAPVVAPEFVVQDGGGVRAVLDGKGLFLFGRDHQMRVWLTPEDLVYKGEDGQIRAALKANREASSFVLRDAQGDETDLGSTTLTRPGGTQHRSAASVVLMQRGTVVRALP
jgi:hypothetical protein